MLKSLNYTTISLIPKVELPTDLKHYRPISLCNVLYKVISNILANRLKPVLEHCISKNQSAFIPNRQILDNIIISHECLHFLKNKRQGKDGYTAIKLDMSKAYDRVEWGYLRAVMEKMGFCKLWVEWIMECITSVSYSFNIIERTRSMCYRLEVLGKVTHCHLTCSFYALKVSRICLGKQLGRDY